MTNLTTYSQLEALVGTPPAMVLAKTITHLDPGALAWISASALMVSSVVDESDTDVVLAGGLPGWATGDAAFLNLPYEALDAPARFRPGAGFGSVFLVPSLNEMLRINGRVAANDGDEVKIAVEECYIHCGKALIRSDFWAAMPHELETGTIDEVIEQCRFIGLATSNAAGHADLSPKGDPAGMMIRKDDSGAWFADRPGNRRIDSFRNIIEDPRIAGALIVPGVRHLVIMKGRACIIDDLPSRQAFTVRDKVPELVTHVTGIQLDIRESAALSRASAWPARAAPAGLSGGKIAAGHLKLSKGLAARLAGTVMSVPGLVERELAKDYKKNLY